MMYAVMINLLQNLHANGVYQTQLGSLVLDMRLLNGDFMITTTLNAPEAEQRYLVVVQFQAHAHHELQVTQRDVILEDCVPFPGCIFSGLVPVCAATSFFKSPIVSSSLHLTLTFFPSLSLRMTSIISSSPAREVSVYTASP